MACRIDGNSIKKGITSLIAKDLLKSEIFTQTGENFTIKNGQYFEAQDLINNVNSKFSAEVVKKISDKEIAISIPDSMIKNYIVETKDGNEVVKVIDINANISLEENSWNNNEMFTYLNYPEISQMTYDKLKEFLVSINPDFRVEELDNLSVEGMTSLKDFLIQVKTLSKFKTLPEETAHVLIELLPDSNPLKQDMLNNITSFAIYGQTLDKYENIYRTSDGKVDYDKIKREASAKLVGEYITAISTNDNTRIQALTKTKQNFIERWINKFLKFLGMNMLDKTHAYADIAGLILSGKNDQSLKTAKEVEDISYTNSYFYRASQEQLYDNAISLIKLPPEKLSPIIISFSKEFGKRFNEILKEDKYSQLNEELKKDGVTLLKINRLSEIQANLKDAGIGIRALVDSDAYLMGIKQFLEAVDSLGMLSDSILKVIENKEQAKSFDEAINNIKELENYLKIYETFVNILSSDLAGELIQSGIGSDVVGNIIRTQSNFETVNQYILNRMRNDLYIFYREQLSSSNKNNFDLLSAELADAEKVGNKDIIALIKRRMNSLIVTDSQIIAMLSGRGTDIDNFSSFNHLVNAAILNGDPYLSSLTKYIRSKIQLQQQKAKVDVRDLYEKIDPIQKALNEPSYVTGGHISFVDESIDRTTGETRKVLTFLHPHKGIEVVKEKLRKAVADARKEREDADKNSAEYEAYDSVYKEKLNDFNEFLEKYMNRPYIKEYYNFHKEFEKDSNYIDGIQEFSKLTDEIKALEEWLNVESESEEDWDKLAMLRRTRSNLLHEYDQYGDEKKGKELEKVKILKQYFDGSNKFKELNEDQTQRTYQIAENRYLQKVDFAIQEIRRARLKTIQDVENRLREILNDKRLRIVELYKMASDNSLDYDVIKALLAEKWYAKNINVRPNQAFYDYEKGIIDEVNKLQKKGELSENDIKMKEAYEERRKILHGSRDTLGQINPASLSTEEKENLMALDDYIEDLKKNRPPVAVNLEDFSPEDRTKWDEYNETINNPNSKFTRKRDAIVKKNKLTNKYKNTGIAKNITDLFSLLGSLSEKKATYYYWDKMETLIPSISEYGKFLREKSIQTESTDLLESIREFEQSLIQAIDNQDDDTLDFDIYSSEDFKEYLQWLLNYNENLYDWFNENHTAKTVFDNINGRYVKLPFVRNSIYTQKIPVRDEHKVITYNKKYQKNRVKDEYRTGYNPETKQVELKVGVHVSNRETRDGYQEFLPLLPEQGELKDSPYRNEEYYRMKNSTDTKDKLRFKYLELLKETSLKKQEGLPARLRLWMDAPVMHLSNVESLIHIPTAARQKYDKFRTIFGKYGKNQTGEAELAMEGINTIEDEDATALAAENEEGLIINDKIKKIVSDIPKLGMAQRLDINVVSRDLLKSIGELIFKSHEFEGRSEAQPVVKALNRVMKDNEYKGNMSNKERAQKFESIYSQMILQEVPGGVLNNQMLRRVSRFITGNTALRMLADPLGGIINYSSAMVNNIIEGAAGQYLNLQQLAKGKYLAERVLAALMADFNKKSNLSYYTLLFEDFDFIQGSFEEDLLDRSSSLDKKASIKQLLMIPRSSGELFVQTAIGMAVLERHKVVNSIDGKTYSMYEIYKKTGNNLTLKEGFPEEYNPLNGKIFIDTKEKINHINLSLHGNYAKIDQSEASRYALGKLAENMKRWFMPAIQRRFGRETNDIIFEEPTEGYYRTAARAALNYFSALGHLDFGGAKQWVNYFTKTARYRQNLQRFAAEVVQATLLLLTFMVALGYSGDDKNKKLNDNSWIHNTAILLALRVYSETTAYVPFPPFGFQEMKRNALAPFSLPTDAVSNFAAIFELGAYQIAYWLGVDSLKSNLYYAKDSGFWYSEKGDSKLFKYIIKTFGYTGYTLDPIQYIKTFNSLQQRLK